MLKFPEFLQGGDQLRSAGMAGDISTKTSLERSHGMGSGSNGRPVKVGGGAIERDCLSIERPFQV